VRERDGWWEGAAAARGARPVAPPPRRGTDPAARALALFIGLLPPDKVAAALGLPLVLAGALQGYVRHIAATLAGPAFVASVLGPPLAPASGGMVVRKPVSAWIEGWTDPLLAAYAPGPRATVSAASAWPSRDAAEAALGRPLSEIKGGDHPFIMDVTATTGEPATRVGANGVFSYGEIDPARALAVDGSTSAVTGTGTGLTVRVSGSVDGLLFGRRLKAKNEYPVYDPTLRRPLSAARLGVGNAVKGIPVWEYGVANASAAACGDGAGGVARCAAPDAFAWAWRADSVYGCATQVSLPRFFKADALRAAAAAVVPDGNSTLHDWRTRVEPFTGVAVAGDKSFQVAHRVAGGDVTVPTLGLPAAAAGGGAASGAWMPTHWVRTGFELKDLAAVKMRDAIRVRGGREEGGEGARQPRLPRPPLPLSLLLSRLCA